MRKVLLTLTILLTSYATIFAQGIEIAFALPVGNCQLSDNTAKMLRSKFLPAMTESGVETAEVHPYGIPCHAEGSRHRSELLAGIRSGCSGVLCGAGHHRHGSYPEDYG